MIRRFNRWLVRRILAADIRAMQDDLACLDRQRINDCAAQRLIAEELAIAQRKMQALNQEDLRCGAN